MTSFTIFMRLSDKGCFGLPSRGVFQPRTTQASSGRLEVHGLGASLGFAASLDFLRSIAGRKTVFYRDKVQGPFFFVCLEWGKIKPPSTRVLERSWL
jgi:hypothetical protein